MQTAPVVIDASRCNACGVCGAVCPRHVPVTEEVDGVRRTTIAQERLDVCLACGQCAAVCAKDAIHVEGLDPAGYQDAPDWSIAPETFRDALATRRSVRRYKDRPVPRAVLQQIVAAAALAPVAAGRPTTGVIVLDGPEKLAALTKIAYGLYANIERALRNPIGRFFVKRRAGNRSDEARALLGIPADREVHASITLGYPKYRYRRTIPRQLADVRYL